MLRALPTQLPMAGGWMRLAYDGISVVDAEKNAVSFVVDRGADDAVLIRINGLDYLDAKKSVYHLRYRATVSLPSDFKGAPDFTWFVTGFNWDVPIATSSFKLSFPRKPGETDVAAGTNVTATVGRPANQVPIDVERSGETLRVLHTNILQPGEGMVVAVKLPAGFWPQPKDQTLLSLKRAFRFPIWMWGLVASLALLQFILGRYLVWISSKRHSDTFGEVPLTSLHASVLQRGRLTRSGLLKGLAYLAELGEIDADAAVGRRSSTHLRGGDDRLRRAVIGPATVNLPAFAVEKATIKQLAKDGLVGSEDKPRWLLWKLAVVSCSGGVAWAWGTIDNAYELPYAVGVVVFFFAALILSGQMSPWGWWLLLPLTCLDRLGLYKCVVFALAANWQGFRVIWPPLAAAGAAVILSYVVLALARNTGVVFWQTPIGRTRLQQYRAPRLSPSYAAEWKGVAAQAIYKRPLPVRIGVGPWSRRDLYYDD